MISAENLHQSLLPTEEFINHPVDTQSKNGDPRKTAFAVRLMDEHKSAVAIYQDFGLMIKQQEDELTAQKDAAWGHSLRKSMRTGESTWERRKHFAPEHMVTVIAGSRAFGQLFEEKGLLTTKQVFEIEEAAAVHDAGKELEFLLVNTALQDHAQAGKLAEVLSASTVQVRDQKSFLAKIFEVSQSLLDQKSKGKRGLAAYDLAGEINSLRLKEKGVSPKLVEIQKMVGHASCPETERLVDTFDTLQGDERTKALQIFILHYIDDVVTNPNVIDPTITLDENSQPLNALDGRCIQNECNPKYQEYNQAWKNDPRNTTGETAFEMQRWVGHKVENLLAKLLGIDDPLLLPAIIDRRMQDMIRGNWKQSHLTLAQWQKGNKFS